MPARASILCVGLTTLDLVYRVGRIPAADEKTQATSIEIAAGGPAANAAVTAAALGAQVTLVTAIGAHPLADLVRRDLATHGVRVIDTLPGAAEPPPVSSVTVDAAGRRTIVSRNAGDWIAAVPENGLPAADLTLVDGHHPLLAVDAAHSAERLLVDAGSWRPVFTEIFPYAEVVACSAAFRHPAAQSADAPPDTSGRDGSPDAGGPPDRDEPFGDGGSQDAGVSLERDALTAAAVGVPHVIVTHGPSPVRWFTRPNISDLSPLRRHALAGVGWPGDEFEVPPVDALDTAGAGDAFHGALAVGLAAGLEVRDAIPYAIRVAGVRVAHAGPRGWLSAL